MNSKLILGTVQFGLHYGINNTVGKLNEEQVFDILETAYELGIRTLDTAEVYGNAHDIISNFHRQHEIRFNIISKYSSSNKDYPEELTSRIQQHCLRFNVDYLEGYMFHSFADFVLKKDAKILDKIKKSGLVKKIGVSVYSNTEIEEVLTCESVDLIQLPFNLFDNEYQRKNTLERAKKRNVEIHTRSAFLQGLFFKDAKSLTGNLSTLKNDLKDVQSLAQKSSITLAELALNYPLNKSYIDKVVIGVDSLEQLMSNVKAVGLHFDRTVYKSIDLIQIKNNNILNPTNWKV